MTEQAVEALDGRGLPPLAATSLQALVGPHSPTPSTASSRTRSPNSSSPTQFQTAWETANREAHAQMVAVLTGKDTDTVEISGNAVSVNLATLIDTVKPRLVDRGFTLVNQLPADPGAVHDLPVRRHHQGPERVPAPQRRQHLAADPGPALPGRCRGDRPLAPQDPRRGVLALALLDAAARRRRSTSPGWSTSNAVPTDHAHRRPPAPSTTRSSSSSGSTCAPSWSSRSRSPSSPG